MVVAQIFAKGAKKMKKEIPIFFSSDNNYVPYLDVALRSLISNSSKDYNYKIIILNTGLLPHDIARLKKNECDGVKISFVNISKRLEKIKSRFKDAYHFSIVMYYRLFIASLFPEYNKVIYLDCDLVVLGDVSKLYEIELSQNILAAAPEQHVQSTPEFRDYAEYAIGVDPDSYVNSGVLLINLENFRKEKIEEKFVSLIKKYDFDLLDPDQAYLNYLCMDKILRLPNGWNKEPLMLACEGAKNIVHYALYKKPWQFDDVIDGEYFWHYAKSSPFFDDIIRNRANFTDADRQKKAQTAVEILEHAKKIVAKGYTFSKMLCEDGVHYGKISS
jgi:lipopolysaccharide biosynthesis glycosyltransferase